ncbi:MAG: DUF4234 domain-containing protein [Candidatus Kapaibacterium sp.]
MEIKERNVVAVYLLMFVTLGIYAIYWSVKTKEEINALGADIPTAWLIIVPIANIYWAWKYCEGYSRYVRKDNQEAMWFIIYLLASIIIPAIVQSDLNKIARRMSSSRQP